MKLVSKQQKMLLIQPIQKHISLVIKQKKDVNEVDHILESKGLDESQRNSIIVSLLQIKNDKKAKRKQRIANALVIFLYGGIWCIGGITLTCLSLCFK